MPSRPLLRRLQLAVWTVSGCLFLTGCTGCFSKPNPEQVREKTAAATATIKSDAKAMAQGIREGWNRDKPLDLNSASKDQLQSLPGITAVQADRIIAARPYRKPDDLLTRRILSRAAYDRISTLITAKP